MDAKRDKWVGPESMIKAIGRTRWLGRERDLDDRSSKRRSKCSESLESRRVWRSKRVGSESGVVGLSKWRISSSSAIIRDMGSSMDVTSTEVLRSL